MFKLLRTNALKLALAIVALAVGTPTVSANPTGVFTIIVPVGPGSGGDNFARFFAPKLSEALGQPVIVENRPGADTWIGVQSLLSAPSDGKSMLLISGASTVMLPLINTKINYVPTRDIQPLVTFSRYEAALVTVPGLPYTTPEALFSAARTKPRSVSVGNYGTSYQLGLIDLERLANVEFNIVSYKSATAVISDVIGGHIETALVELGAAMPFIKSGKLHAVAIAGVKRHPELPSVPTLVESGFPKFTVQPWTGFGIRAGTPDAVARKLESTLLSIIATPQYRSFALSYGADPSGLDHNQTADLIKVETARYADLIKLSNSRGR